MAVKYFINSLNPNDAIVVSGKDLCTEAFKQDDDRFLYLPDNFGQSLSLAIGVALSNNKRVFFLCEDYYLLNNLSAAAQAAATRNKNIFLVVFISGQYQFADGMPNIFKSLPRPKSILFDMGFTTHDYSKMYQTADGAKTTSFKLLNARGPLSIYITVDPGQKDLEDINFNLEENLKRFSMFMVTSEDN
jgi:hypothetical protein